MLFSTSAVSPTDAWAAGYTTDDDGSHTLLEHWDGTAWKIVPGSEPGRADDTLSGVAARTSSDVWAVGSDTVQGKRAAALIEHWDGRMWRTVATPGSSAVQRLLAVAAPAPNLAWAVGLSGSARNPQPIVLRWDGSSWKDDATPAIAGGALYDITAAGPADAWAVGMVTHAGSVKTLVLHWDGVAWTVSRSPTPRDGGRLSGIAMITQTDGWAVGRAGSNGGARPLAMRWDGATWAEVATAPAGMSGGGQLAHVAASSWRDVWAVGGFLDPRTRSKLTMLEHWDGTSWSFARSLGPVGDGDYLAGLTSVPGLGLWATGYATMRHAPAALIERMCPATIGTSGIQPGIVRSVLGETLTWRVEGGSPHALADASGLGLFSSGTIQPGAAFTYAFPGAGTFWTVDPTTGSRGQVAVAMRKHPIQVRPGTWRLAWGLGRAPHGMRFVVQIHRPTSAHFEPWLTTESPSATFTPGGVGIWVFRAALQDLSSGVMSGWSPVKRIMVA